MESQRTNPGGILDPGEIVGRDELVARLWRILERRSLYITAERRMGKTSIVRDKMGREAPPGVAFVYMDTSRAVTPLEFVEKLFADCTPLLDFSARAKGFVALARRHLAGSEIKAGVSLKLPNDLGADWKSLLESLLGELAENQKQVVLAFDELPLMLLAIKRHSHDGEAVVMELLDTLRAARQTKTALRMIYTGSLGLHHILSSLKEQGYQNDPTNDMALIEVEPLTPEYAAQLARRLLLGEAIPTADITQSATHLAEVTDGMPYYIQHLVEEMAEQGTNGDPDTIDRALASRLTDLRDPWQLRYYDERIDTHYPAPFRPIARGILDQIAARELPQSFEDVLDGIDPSQSIRDPESVRAVLRLLGADHYLSRDQGGAYRFRYPFLARVWRTLR